MAGANHQQQTKLLYKTLLFLSEMKPSSTPAEVGHWIHRHIREELGNTDPYNKVKETSTREALALYPWMKNVVKKAEDPLETAVRLSIAGNIIDFGPKLDYDLAKSVKKTLTKPLSINHLNDLRNKLKQVSHVLYLADNAGETVFDRVLIEFINIPVIYAVKESPILNDATQKDALEAGIDKVAEIVSTGSNAPGTILDHCSASFQKLYRNSDLIISKGQGNYETLSEEGSHIFFLLIAKCPVIASDLKVKQGSIVIKQG